MDKKKILFIAGTILIIILGVVAITISKTKTMTNEIDDLNGNVLKDTVVDNFSLTDQSVITRDGLSTYMANLKNNANETKHIDNLYIIFTFDNEEVNALALSDIDVTVDNIVPIVINFDRDISNTTNVKYEITKEMK